MTTAPSSARLAACLLVGTGFFATACGTGVRDLSTPDAGKVAVQELPGANLAISGDANGQVSFQITSDGSADVGQSVEFKAVDATGYVADGTTNLVNAWSRESMTPAGGDVNVPLCAVLTTAIATTDANGTFTVSFSVIDRNCRATAVLTRVSDAPDLADAYGSFLVSGRVLSSAPAVSGAAAPAG